MISDAVGAVRICRAGAAGAAAVGGWRRGEEIIRRTESYRGRVGNLDRPIGGCASIVSDGWCIPDRTARRIAHTIVNRTGACGSRARQERHGGCSEKLLVSRKLLDSQT
jgi:hypothetical protein